MHTINLTDDELTYLQSLLQQHIRERMIEIHRTDRLAVKHELTLELQTRERVLEKVRQALEGLPAT